MAIPTTNDKVILIDFSLAETNVFLLNEYETNQQFSTLDVGSAFIGFKAPIATDLDGMTAKISLVNLDDDSFVNHTENIVSLTNHDETENTYFYQVRRAELERQGKWIGRVSFVDINGKTWGTRKFTFLIEGDILDAKTTKLYAIDSVEDFMEDMSALMLDFNGFILDAQTTEATRGTDFTATMLDFTNTFNQAQQLHTTTFNANEAGRTGDFNASELNRTQTFNASEASRTETFNASETMRGNTFTQNENARIETFTQNEASRQNTFNLGESTRNDGFDADHLRAGTDHTQAVNDSNRAGTDHTRAVADSTQAGTDHTTAVNDHSTAQTDHTTAVADHTTNLANNTIVQGYNTRLSTVEIDTTAMATNVVTNGDFSNGVTGWKTQYGTGTVANNELTYTINEIGANRLETVYSVPIGDRYYVRFDIFPKYARDTSIRIGINASAPFTSIPNIWNTHSAVVVANESGLIRMYHSTTTNYVVGDTIKFRRILSINLTATFGKGNEPTVEQMDEIMSKFENSWFDGTKNLFRASDTLKKQIAIDARTEFDAKNLVVNGDFSNGTTGWVVSSGASVTTTNNVATLMASASGAFIGSASDSTYKVGNKYYRAEDVKADSNLVRFTSFSGNTVYHSGSGNYERLRAIGTLTSNTGYAVGVLDGRTSGWTPVYIKNAISIDLTTTFGAGKEPTLAEMDRLMARYPNSWFDGVKPIQTIETLYQEKANKVQEAWITPTLLNGWVAESGFTIGYYKDTLGLVHLRGRISGGSANSNAFILPVGYRPSTTMQYYSTNLATISQLADGNVRVNGFTTYAQLDTITFRAEQ